MTTYLLTRLLNTGDATYDTIISQNINVDTWNEIALDMIWAQGAGSVSLDGNT